RDGGSHADRFWAGALCAAAAAGGKVEYAYEPLHNSQESNYDDFGDDDFGGHDQSSYLAAATTKGRATWH
ncbi:MAG: hypothetical protein ORO03_06280, partial [Alphaproteobacteria bacterium]|nr:hypothetical protein [Alphaproteobacteria bacterium]